MVPCGSSGPGASRERILPRGDARDGKSIGPRHAANAGGPDDDFETRLPYLIDPNRRCLGSAARSAQQLTTQSAPFCFYLVAFSWDHAFAMALALLCYQAVATNPSGLKNNNLTGLAFPNRTTCLQRCSHPSPLAARLADSPYVHTRVSDHRSRQAKIYDGCEPRPCRYEMRGETNPMVIHLRHSWGLVYVTQKGRSLHWVPRT